MRVPEKNLWRNFWQFIFDKIELLLYSVFIEEVHLPSNSAEAAKRQ